MAEGCLLEEVCIRILADLHPMLSIFMAQVLKVRGFLFLAHSLYLV